MVSSTRKLARFLPLPWADRIEDALDRARAKDEEIARASEGAQYAAGEDPYRHDDEAESDEDDADDGADDGAVADVDDENDDEDAER